MLPPSAVCRILQQDRTECFKLCVSVMAPSPADEAGNGRRFVSAGTCLTGLRSALGKGMVERLGEASGMGGSEFQKPHQRREDCGCTFFQAAQFLDPGLEECLVLFVVHRL